MAITTVTVKATECKCERCGHVWLIRLVRRGHRWVSGKPNPPVACARCKNPYWHTPRKEKR